jgi:hypothetical protein
MKDGLDDKAVGRLRDAKFAPKKKIRSIATGV